MRCDDAETLIQDRLDAALSPDEERELRAHLRECVACAHYALELSRLTEGLGSLDAPAIGDDAWEQAVQTALRPPRRTAQVWAVLAVAAVLVGLVWLAASRWRSAPDGHPQPTTAVPAVARQPSPPETGDPPAPTPQVTMAGTHDGKSAKTSAADAQAGAVTTGTPRFHRRRPQGPLVVEEPLSPPETPPPPGPVPYAPEDLHTLPTGRLVAAAEGPRMPLIDEELVRVAMLRMADVPPEAMLSPRQLLQLAGNPLDPPPEIASAANIGEE